MVIINHMGSRNLPDSACLVLFDRGNIKALASLCCVSEEPYCII